MGDFFRDSPGDARGIRARLPDDNGANSLHDVVLMGRLLDRNGTTQDT